MPDQIYQYHQQQHQVQREDLEKLDTTFTAGTPSTVTIGKDGSIRTVHWWRWEQLRETLRLSSIWASFVERCKECLLPDLSMRPKNPIGLLIGINKRQCLAFMAMWLVWILDAIDFCTIPIIMSEIAEYFDTEPSNVTMAIIATLGTRPVGAAISGPIADRFGRRIPLLAIVVLYIGFEVASGFSNSLGMYFGLRAAFGVCIGGAWGPANSLAMESLPIETRGIYSGIFHSGYPIGFLLANMFYVAVVPRFGWRALYWFEVIPAVLAFVLVYFVHESNAWKQARKQARENEVSFSKQVSQMLKHHWLLCIYAVLLLSAMSYMAHAAQDLYATFLKMQLGYTPQQATITLVIMNCGAFIGGLLVGYLSEYWGRRFTIIWACLAGLCFVPLWILPHSLVALSFGSFMVMVFVQGTWGCIPAHMIEISPDEFRSTFPGMSFQLANLISSPSVLILAKAGESNRLPDGRSNYAWPQLTSLCALFGIVAILTFLGTEQRAKNLEISDAPTSNAKSEVV